MAEGGIRRPAPNSYGQQNHQQVCRYFLHGACNKGDQCRFSHDKTRAVPADTVCKYYLAGCCFYGERCRYDHVKTASVPGSQQPVEPTSVKPFQSNMVKLTKGGPQGNHPVNGLNSTGEDAGDSASMLSAGANAFVPGRKFHGSGLGYAEAAQGADGYVPAEVPDVSIAESGSATKPSDKDLLCPYFAHGHCPYDEKCQYTHGDLCDMCGLPKLHPTDPEQRKRHEKECLMEHEQDMETSFLIQNSSDKECGICLERVMDKVGEGGRPADTRFGILENCNHAFCLACIKEWRMKRVAEKVTHRSCPICRTESRFVTPSQFFVDEAEMKKKLIDGYLTVIAKKPCQYFKQGQGKCPFGNACFYLHALPDGTIAPPEPKYTPRRLHRQEGDTFIVDGVSIWDFMQRRIHMGEEVEAHEGVDQFDLILAALEEHGNDGLDPELVMSLEHEINLMSVLNSSTSGDEAS